MNAWLKRIDLDTFSSSILELPHGPQSPNDRSHSLHHVRRRKSLPLDASSPQVHLVLIVVRAALACVLSTELTCS